MGMTYFINIHGGILFFLKVGFTFLILVAVTGLLVWMARRFRLSGRVEKALTVLCVLLALFAGLFGSSVVPGSLR